MAGDMSPDEFREFGRAAVDFIADYIENIRERYGVEFRGVVRDVTVVVMLGR